MGMTDELNVLHELHQRRGLTDDEYTRAKAKLLAEPSPNPAVSPAMATLNALRRSASDRWIAGVCGGVARATGVESWVWRLIFAVLLLWGGVGLLVYVLLWIFVPQE